MTVLPAPVRSSAPVTTGRTPAVPTAPARAGRPALPRIKRVAGGTTTRTPRAPRADVPETQTIPQAIAQPAREPVREPARESARQPGEFVSFSSYVRARGSVLLRTARSLTSNPCDAEDLLQTALTKTYVAWDRIEDRRALDGYVRRALLNTRTSQWRKRKVDEYACDELPETGGAPVQDPAEQQALRDAMWRAVVKLPARQRAMVVLRYYEDFSEAQTAELLGVSVGTVKSAVSRALGKLREDPELTAAA
jgi:RNA polymerase sigma-70 factor (sigma-E family)